MKFKKFLTFMLATTVLATSANVPVFAQQSVITADETTKQASDVEVEATGAEGITAGNVAGQETVTYKNVTFYRATEAYTDGEGSSAISYEGMPLFNGEENDLDTYVDLIMEEIGLDGWIDLITNANPKGTYTDSEGESRTYNFPNVLSSQADVGLDHETQWPNQLSQAQTWNKDLVSEAGSVFGDEIRSKASTNTISGSAAITAHTAQIDARSNPLSGRYDEGFGEDAFLIGEMADAWTEGMIGSDDDLYMKSVPFTKHWTTYNSEFFRLQGGNNVSSRTFYEYYAKAAETPFEDGNIAGYMSSYGNMNGVPATATFIHDFAQKMSKDGLVSGCDFMSEFGYLEEQLHINASAFSNGYDAHYSTSLLDRTASMLLAGHKQGGTMGMDPQPDMKTIVKNAVDNKVEGLTEQDIYKVARPTVVTLARTGALDERNQDGTPRFYKYNAVTGVDHTSPASQQTALEIAEEGVVLLKNENDALPLNKDANAAVFGNMAELFQYGQYSSEMDNSEGSYGEGAEDSVLEAITRKIGIEKVDYSTGNRVVAYKGAGGYLTASNAETGAQLTVSDVAAAEATANAAYQFEYADWGQDAFSLKSLANNRWLNIGLRDHAIAGKTYGLTNSVVSNSADPSLKAGSGAALAVSNMPQFIAKTSTGEENQYYLRFGAKLNGTDFATNWAFSDKMGWYMQSDGAAISVNGEARAEATDGSQFNPTAVMGNLTPGVAAFENAQDKSPYAFTEETVKEVGADSETATQDYAIVVIGQPYNGLSGEGVDREYLNLSTDQMQLAKVVAQNYADAGKKTIVVINAEYPVEAEELQNDANISAIVFNPHGGEYDGSALANILYGDATPTGRLVSTWYDSESALPAIDSYSLPNNAMINIGGEEIVGLTLDDLDDAVTVDMTEADLQQSDLTYMYADEEDVTYEFGYGLSYSQFDYSDLSVQADAENNLTVQVTVTNSGEVATSDVVQIYASNPGSTYGDAAVDKKLIGFDKVELAAGASATVTIPVKASALEIWDVNAGAYIVENGTYQISAAHSSDLTQQGTLQQSVALTGSAIAAADTSKSINVWSNSYDSANVKYVEYSKGQTAAAAAADSDEMFSVMAKSADAWAAIPSVDLTGQTKATLNVASTSAENSIELHLDSPTGDLIGTASFGATEAVTKERTTANKEAADAGSYTELGYQTVEVNLAAASGAHNVYVVFKNANARIESVKFDKVAYTVSFNTNGGNTINSQSVSAGALAEKVNDPVREGYRFDGWYNGDQKWDFATSQVTGDITLTARWTKLDTQQAAATYTVKFNTSGGNRVKQITVKQNASYGKLPSAKRKGYTFAGWYTRAKNGTRVTASTKCTRNITLYAHWNKVSVAKVSSPKLKVGRQQVKVTVKKISKVKGYQIRYSQRSNMKSAKNVNTTKTTRTIKKLKAGKKYYVQVRAYKNDSTGAKVFGKWSNKKAVTVR